MFIHIQWILRVRFLHNAYPTDLFFVWENSPERNKTNSTLQVNYDQVWAESQLPNICGHFSSATVLLFLRVPISDQHSSKQSSCDTQSGWLRKQKKVATHFVMFRCQDTFIIFRYTTIKGRELMYHNVRNNCGSNSSGKAYWQKNLSTERNKMQNV